MMERILKVGLTTIYLQNSTVVKIVRNTRLYIVNSSNSFLADSFVHIKLDKRKLKVPHGSEFAQYTFFSEQLG